MLADFVDLGKLIPGALLDVDVLPRGQWLGVAETSKGQQLLFNGQAVPVPRSCAFPIARWLRDDAAVLVDARINTPEEVNAWVVDLSGSLLAAFAVGDGVKDVLGSPDHIVVTYFDEGVFGFPGPNQEGVAIFSTDGALQIRYASDIGEPAIADCYCASWISQSTFAFIPYTDFPFVEFDLKTRRRTLQDLPEPLHGASALTVRGKDAVLWSPYAHRHALIHWEIGTNTYSEVGTYSGRLRGILGGSMLETGSTGYTVLDPLA